MARETDYSARHHEPDWLIRATAQTIQLPVYRDGALAVPASGTVSVYDAEGTAIVNAQAVTVSGGVASYTIAALTLPATLALSWEWHETWTLTMPDGVAHVFYRQAALVLRRLYPVISDDDLTALHTQLAQWRRDGDGPSLQNYIDAAWRDVIGRLLNAGKRPTRILSPHSLREFHLYHALEIVARDYAAAAGGEGGKWWELTASYAKAASAAWDRLQLVIDEGDDLLPGEQSEPASADSVVMLTRPGSWGWA